MQRRLSRRVVRTDASLTPIRLSVVIPTKNEADNIAALSEALHDALRGISFEVVVVDDSSDDMTRPVLRRTAAADARWRVLERAPEDQTGLGSAVVAGIAVSRGAAICVMDGDLQHPPRIIPKLLEAIEAGAGVAVASRYMPGGSRAGLGGTMRVWASRLCTWAAQFVFPEARRTSDPLSGFFCARRSAVAGIELRPMGFKILLEVLVLAPRQRVADVPFIFGTRHSGESKASTRQAVLYLQHLLSLFRFVPGSARSLKFVLVTVAGLGTFFGVMSAVLALGVRPELAWIAAALASATTSVALHQTTTFRDLPTHGVKGGAGVHYALAVASAAASFLAFVALLQTGSPPPLAMALVAQCLGVLLMAGIHMRGIRRRVWPRQAAGLDLVGLGHRLNAQVACWVELTDGRVVTPNGWSSIVSAAVVERAAGDRYPVLFVQAPSLRPQRRVNLERASALVIPRMAADGTAEAVALFARRDRRPFEERHLAEALAWMEQRGGAA
ncbi:MAG TPA: glycosyltransferase [Candidatus Dormibacteraeota bacterium]